MKHLKKITKSTYLITLIIASFLTRVSAQTIPGYETIGDAKWTLKDGIIEGTGGQGHLVTSKSYKDFTITLEFWKNDATISGVFFRCENRVRINKGNALKININDVNKAFPTGSLVDIVTVKKQTITSNKWNKLEITSKGNHITVKLNSELAVDTTYGNAREGPIAFQAWQGIIKFRNIKIKTL